MKLLKSGDKIPFFRLINQDGVQINCSDYLGKKMLIYFYPKAMTPGCTLQACKLRDTMNDFIKLNLKIIGISSDTPEKLLKFFKQEMLNFTLLSDINCNVAKQFGVWGEKKFMNKVYYGIHRVSFLINNIGRIEQVFTNFTPKKHAQIILNYLNNLN